MIYIYIYIYKKSFTALKVERFYDIACFINSNNLYEWLQACYEYKNSSVNCVGGVITPTL